VQAGAAENVAAQRRGEALADALAAALALSSAAVVVVATAVKRETLHPRLLRGHCFAEHWPLPLPQRAERLAILRVLTHAPADADADADAAALADVAFATEGHAPIDLVRLHQRARHHVAVRARTHGPTLRPLSAAVSGSANSGDHVSTNNHDKTTTSSGHGPVSDDDDSNNNKGGRADPSLLGEDWDVALAGFTPSGLLGVKTTTTAVRWSDIGGAARSTPTLCVRLSLSLAV
jgi:SpoVK/Ycf46/Vps4 family AAA+-type ATPase